MTTGYKIFRRWKEHTHTHTRWCTNYWLEHTRATSNEAHACDDIGIKARSCKCLCWSSLPLAHDRWRRKRYSLRKTIKRERERGRGKDKLGVKSDRHTQHTENRLACHYFHQFVGTCRGGNSGASLLTILSIGLVPVGTTWTCPFGKWKPGQPDKLSLTGVPLLHTNIH